MEYTDPLNQLLKEVRASSSHPRTTILVAHGLIELIVNTLIKLKCKNGKRIVKDNRTYPHSSKTVILHEIGVLHQSELALLDRFRKLRNEFVHDVNFHVTNDRLLAVRGDWNCPLEENASGEEEIKRNLVILCVSVVAQVWGQWAEDLEGIFKNPLSSL